MSIEDDLQNWGRWCRTRLPEGHCASIEHRFKNKLRPDMTPTGWGDWIPEVPPPILPPINPLQALEVERVMRHLPDGHRKALKLHYVYRMPVKLICLRLVLRHDRWGQFLGDAQHMVKNLLQGAEKKRICFPIIQFPATAETL